MEQRQLEKLVKEILGDSYVSLKIQRYVLTEDVTDHKAQIACALYLENSESYIGVDGAGVGMIDALFQGLKQALSADYPSLNHINFVDFAISGDFSAREGNRSNSDVAGHVRLVVENTSHRRFRFESTSPSISASSVAVVLKAVEHFTNAEVAVLRVYDWIDDAKKRHRQDLVDKYVNRLTDLVKNATYSESIERRHQHL
jgi:hypothetical protein